MIENTGEEEIDTPDDKVGDGGSSVSSDNDIRSVLQPNLSFLDFSDSEEGTTEKDSDDFYLKDNARIWP